MCSDTDVRVEEQAVDVRGSVAGNQSSDDLNAVEVAWLGKTYQVYAKPSDRLKQLIVGERRRYYKEFVALDDVNFTLPKGEVLGLVGRNGAGKSTLLQLLCGTLTPTVGEVRVNGRIAALLELGAGFNPQFTGRENIYLAAMLMGLTRAEVDDKLEAIIDFSGVRDFIDQPVSTYSSGMYVRLAFSVATSVEPDILVIDEALSVGDGDFARRSFERIMDMRDSGATILFCSHSLYQIEVLCTQAIWLESGRVVAQGEPSEVIPTYQGFLDLISSGVEKSEAAERVLQGQTGEPAAVEEDEGNIASETAVNTEAPEVVDAELQAEEKSDSGDGRQDEPGVVGVGEPRLLRVHGVSSAGSGDDRGESLYLKSSDPLQIDVEFYVPADVLSEGVPRVAVAIHSVGGQLVSSCGSWAQGVDPVIDGNGRGRIRLIYPELPLMKGTYRLGVLLFCSRGLFLYDEVDPAVTLHITQEGAERGLVHLTHRWTQDGADSITSANHWHVVDANEVPQTALLGLFEEVFGYALSPEVWRWKYRLAHTPGSVVLEDGRPVAFNGGIPRPGWVFGQNQALVQMGDVMAAPHVRGVLTKRGPFYQAVEHYITQHIGEGKRYPIGFGFPNDRACRVGVRRGLYFEADRIVELNWMPVLSDAQLTPVSSESYRNHRHYIDELWHAMASELGDSVVGVRDSEWIQYRYLDRPDSDYQLFLVGAEPFVGLIVAKEVPSLEASGSSALELLDFVCARESISSVILAATHLAKDRDAERLFAWATPSVRQWLSSTGCSEQETEVVIPGNALELEYSKRVKGRWWLMGGDTDFR